MFGMVTKKMFFDSPKVVRSVDRAAGRVLSRFGAFVRKTAQQSIKKAPFTTKKARGKARQNFGTKSSQPGKPPYSHTGLLKKHIYFGYNKRRRSVVVGPTRLNKRDKGAAPALLEYGGKAQRSAVFLDWEKYLATGNAKTTVKRWKGTAKYRPRPYMQPAFDKEQPKLPAMWANSVK